MAHLRHQYRNGGLNMKMKKFLAMALACVMALSLVACGGSPASSGTASGSQASSGTATGEPTTLQVYT
jgi:hypothetical protein